MIAALTAASLLPFRVSGGSRTRPGVYCFPHAGGEPSAYRDFALALAPVFDTQPVRLPRMEPLPRGRRSTNALELVEVIGEALTAEWKDPFILLGHSMGAVLAAELTAWLERRGGPVPRLLVVSARSGGRPRRADDLDAADDAALMRWVLSLGGTPPTLFDDSEMRDLVLSSLRHDMHLLHGYRPGYRTLATPVLAIGGTDDRNVSPAELAQWRDRTTAEYYSRLFPGGHFYLYEHAAAVADEVARCARLGTTVTRT